MALQLNCSMCNGNIDPDDLAIRRRIVICPYCSTLNRVVSTGTEKIDHSVPKQFIPETVELTRGESGETIIKVNKIEVASNLNDVNQAFQGIDFIIKLAGLAFILIFVFVIGGALLAEFIESSPISDSNVRYLLWALFCLLIPISYGGVVAFSIIRVSKLGTIPPLRINGGYIYPASMDSSSIEIANIRQIFTTYTKIEYPAVQQYNYQPKPSEYCTVFTLTYEEERVSLIGPLIREEVALYIEEFLEAEFGLHDLPVFGESRSDVELTQVGGEPPVPQNNEKSIDCFSCGASSPKSEQILKQGYVVCGYCQSLTLLYKPDSPQPVLGLPDIHVANLQVELKPEGANFVLAESENDQTVNWLQIEPEFIVIQDVDENFKAIHVTAILKIFVKAFDTKEAVDLENIEGMSLPEMADLVQEYAKAVAKEESYSSEIDAEKLVRKVRFGTQYQVVAQLIEGDLICLLDNIVDVREAVLWSEFTCEKCGVSSDETHHVL